LRRLFCTILALWLVFLAGPALIFAQMAPTPESGAEPATQVRWHQFDAQALQAAEAQNRLILLFISAPWDSRDHTLRTVTFTDPKVRELIAESYVPVLVNTDERPDIFVRFGLARWPTMTILLPDGQPLYHPGEDGKSAHRAGGSFFSPERFVTYFGGMARYYQENSDLVDSVSETTSTSLLQRINVERGRISPEILEVVIGSILDRYKERPSSLVSGANHPDFAMTDLAWYYWGKKADRQVLGTALNHLTDMARGGIHDRIGGGFFRFAQDSLFQVPSFEKLPSTNADAIRAYLTAGQITQNAVFLNIARGALTYMTEQGFDPASNSFRGAMSAWSEGAEEGAYYTWTEEEFDAVLDQEEQKIAGAVYGIGPVGELLDSAPLRNVIYMASGPKLLASKFKLDLNKITETLSRATTKLTEARAVRKKPTVDPTAYGDWSGLSAAAFFQASAVLVDEKYAGMALVALDTLLSSCSLSNGLVAHVCRPGTGYVGEHAFLSDQARVTGALIDAYEWSGNKKYILAAESISKVVMSKRKNSLAGGFTDRKLDPEAPGLLSWPTRQLSEEMAMVNSLLRLFHHSGVDGYRKSARKALQAWADEAAAMGVRAAPFALAVEHYLNPPLEIIVAGEAKPEELASLRRRVLRLHHPWRIVRAEAPGRSLLAERGLEPGEGAQVAFCFGSDCAGPFNKSSNLGAALGAFLKGRSATAPGGAL
jgi:uncharacterized protein YyaL (SSP411 family)